MHPIQTTKLMSNNNPTLVLCLCKNAKGFNKKLILIQYYIILRFLSSHRLHGIVSSFVVKFLLDVIPKCRFLDFISFKNSSIILHYRYRVRYPFLTIRHKSIRIPNFVCALEQFTFEISFDSSQSTL